MDYSPSMLLVEKATLQGLVYDTYENEWSASRGHRRPL